MIRITCIYVSLIVVGLLFSTEIAAQGMTPRPLDSIAETAFIQAQSGSALVRTLVQRLERSNLIVHIESSHQLPIGVAGTMQFVISRGGYRYVRISLAVDSSPEARAVMLGHELQHACELAASDADNLASVRLLYRALGYNTGIDMFETEAAMLIEQQVKTELHIYIAKNKSE